MTQFWEFLKKSGASFALALVFIAVYETARTSFDLGEFRFVGLMFWNQPASSLLVLCFVALLAWLSLLILSSYVDSSFYWPSSFMEMAAMVGVYAVSFSGLYFLLSPFMSWTLTLFPGPHQSLFEFYWATWQKFDALDGWALLLASSVTGVIIVATAVLYVAWENARAPIIRHF